MRLTFLSVCMFALFLSSGVNAADFQLAPYKDKLFAYPRVIDKSSDGNYLLVEYDRERDLIGRDRIPRRKAHYRYVDQGVRWSRGVKTYQSANGTKKLFAVGKQGRNTKIVVIYVHGKGGNRRQGVNDWTFGGNFNRLQNLMTRNKGLLLTPDFTNFKARGKQDIANLMFEAITANPNARIFIACGSMGGGVCWRLAKDTKTAKHIDGLFILGSHWDNEFLTSPVLKSSKSAIPIYFGHGAADPVFAPKTQLAFFKNIKAKNKNYPARFVMFSTGAHGTPIRMIDWRRELNWMLRQ